MISNLNIAVVGPVHPYRGGIAHYTTLLAAHLCQRHVTRVYSFRKQYPGWLFPGRSQLEPSDIPLANIEAQYWLTPWWPGSWRRVTKDWSSWRPAVVVFQWWVPFMAPMTAWLAARASRAGARVVMICHNVLPHEHSRSDAALVRMALSRADRLIVHSASEQHRAQELFPHATVEVVPLPSFVAFHSEKWSRAHARAALNLDGKVVLFFGLVRPYKGLIDLLDALPGVLSETAVQLLVVGEIWGDAELYRSRVKALGLESRVNFVDRYVSNDEAAMYFAATDLAVLPYREATGSAVLQLAFGLGVPVVVTRTGGMGEVVQDGVTGFIVEPGDVDGLTRAMLRFFRDDWGDRMRQAIQQQDPFASWSRLIGAIEREAGIGHQHGA